MAKKQKPPVIIELEKKIGKTFIKKHLDDIWLKNSYALDSRGEVVGLNLDSCNLTDVAPLQHLTALTILYLSDNRLTDVAPLRQLTVLTSLWLDNNQLTSVAPLLHLNTLTDLDLSDNQLTDVTPLKKLTALAYLDLRNNQLTDVEPLRQLTALTWLNLSNNQLTSVAPLQHLTALTTLRLNNNQLTDVAPLQQLTALTYLDLSNNQLTDVAPLQHLTALRQLWLNNNQLASVEPLQQLTALTTLFLDKNQLTDVAPLQHLYQLQLIWLYNNPLVSPPIEIAKQGPEAIRNYFKELEAQSEFVRLLHCKLLIVGNGEVGKTTLMKKILDPAFQFIPGSEETTHGIHIEPWHLNVPFTEPDSTISKETVHIRFWDFGGQDIYHATHQFFLTKRSLYLFVWEVRREDETRSFDYWLNILKLLSAESPVIIIMNKSDLRTKYIEEASFKTKFPNIQSYHQISCLTGRGMTELTEAIRANLSGMPHLRDKLPAVWMKIRDQLDKEKINKNYISLKEYFSLCAQVELNEERADFLSRYLHDLGVILHYRHDPLLEDTVILKPEWATEALYNLIDTREIQENKGSFYFHQLKDFWDCTQYPVDKHLHLMHLMETFELCFNFTGTDQYFVPELLPPLSNTAILEPFKGEKILRFQYAYDFMPDGIVSRFMARLYYLIHEKQFWKNGVILGFDEAQALVQAEPLNRRITMAIKGKNPRDLLAIIRSHFGQIHETLNMEANKHYDEMIPCPCAQCLNAAKPALFKYEKMRLFKSKGMESTTCNESGEPVSIGALLMGLDTPVQKHDLRHSLITALSHLQGIAKTIKDDEDSRNGFIALLLSKDGFRVKDQTRWGSSASGTRPGELDIKIEDDEGRTTGVIEAFKLKGFDSNVITGHLTKVFSYEPSGIENLMIMVYVDSKDFTGLWKKYMGFVPEIKLKYPIEGDIRDSDTGFAEIKEAVVYHDRNGKKIKVSHLFVNMKI